MATFEVLIYPVTIEPHPNADAIELAIIGGYRSIVQKDTLTDGDLVAYVPESSVVPEWLLESMNLVGKLAGKQKNRVKAIRLRGILSQGLCYPLEYRTGVVDVDTHEKSDHWVLVNSEIGGGVSAKAGDDVTESLGITKYEPVIPTCMNGEVFNAFGCTPKFDVENWKKWPDVIKEGEEVIFTEKLHGTWACFGYHPDHTVPIVTSKGLSDKGVAFKFNDANENNLYIKAFKATADYNPEDPEYGKEDVVTRYRRIVRSIQPFYILGEIYGAGVQDLTYGESKPAFRAFDVYIGEPGSGEYLDFAWFKLFCDTLHIPMVPLLYKGPFSYDVMMEHTDGKEVVSGKEACIREGIVINPEQERRDPFLGRVILKSVSDKYLTRKNGTEFN